MHGIIEVKSAVRRLGIVFTMVLILAASANAYTIVMRGGRTIEVPEKFELTATTLTYEVSPGVQISIAVAAIDVTATEKANGEPPGSFLRRTETNGSPAQTISPSRAGRTITNRDLESIARRRLESEEAYEARRKELGLPSVAETRKKAAAQLALFSSELAQKRAADNEAEQYWRGRATALRTDMAALDAEIAYVRTQLEEGFESNYSFTTITRGVPFVHFGSDGFANHRWRDRFPRGTPRRGNIFVAPGTSRLTARSGFDGDTQRARVSINSGVWLHGGYLRAPVLPVGVIGAGLPAFDYSYERSELITRFNELGAARAGLNARWRELEEEARRAGAQPGWLRP